MCAKTEENILKVLRKYEDDLLAIPGVIAVGVGFRHRSGVMTEELALVVTVLKKKRPEEIDPRDWIPSELDGVPVDIQETGPVIGQV